MQLSKHQKYFLFSPFAFAFAFIVFRLIFFMMYATGESYESSELLKAFYLGTKFDFRVALVLQLPFLLSLIPALDPWKQTSARNGWSLFYALLSSILLFTYLTDFAYYSYLHARVNASILGFLANPLISFEMVWQSYPVIPSMIAILIVLIGLTLFFRKWVFKSEQEDTFSSSKWLSAGLVFFYLAAGHAKLSQYPLRWSEAFFSTHSFISALASNPVHYFFDTMKNREKDYDPKEVAKYYPMIAEYLGVTEPNVETLNFSRKINPKPLSNLDKSNPPNVVFIIMESFAAYKTGTFGNTGDTSPAFDAMAKQGLLFKNFFVPVEGTARSIFGYLTGVPDVTTQATSTRNPLIINQNTLVNAFKDYEKFYFIGGSANWGNIRGILANNIPGIEIIEEGMFQSARTDVWGISDLDLFKEAYHRLSKRAADGKPFFAFIQTAGFHRPYTIPKEHGDFVIKPELSSDELKKYGFTSTDEYNSLRFSDYSLGEFMRLSKTAPYFDNTIFIVVGDHGLPDFEASFLPKGYRTHLLSRFQTPLLFYSPKYFPTLKTVEPIAQSLDVFPTLVSMMGLEATNKGFGRNLLDLKPNSPHLAFTYVYYHSPPQIGVLDGSYYVLGTSGKINELYDYMSENPSQDLKEKFPERFEQMKNWTNGLHQTAKYMLYHNQTTFDQKKKSAE